MPLLLTDHSLGPCLECAEGPRQEGTLLPADHDLFLVSGVNMDLNDLIKPDPFIDWGLAIIFGLTLLPVVVSLCALGAR